MAKDGTQVAATLTPTNIAGMVSSGWRPGSWAKAQWIVSPSALAQLFTLATVTKNVAGHRERFGPRAGVLQRAAAMASSHCAAGR